MKYLSMETVTSLAMTYGLRLIGALVLWVVGGLIIKAIRALIRKSSSARHVDPTLIGYIDSAANILLRVLLVVAILSLFGVETASFAAILAAGGVAIGLAWSGLLANFAAGVFLVMLRPFKTGDVIAAAGVTGVVKEIGLFATTIDTGDAVRVFVGNNKLFGDNIVNYSINPFRRVDLLAQISGAMDPNDAIAQLQERLGRIPNVVKDPAPVVEIVEFTPAGPKLAVRPFCSNDHYWQVFFDTNRAIVEVGAANHWPPAAPLQFVKQV